MLSIFGMALTALGTILAIVHPSIGADWAGEDTDKHELRLRMRYYVGITMIVVGTIMQMLEAWMGR